MHSRTTLIWIWQRKEAFIWLGAILFLALNNPACQHYTLCPFHNLGIEYCPGCGLGRSIGFLFRLDIISSVLAHPLGIPALILLIYRAVDVLKKKSTFQLSTL